MIALRYFRDAFPSSSNLPLVELLHLALPWEQRDAPRAECFLSRTNKTYTYGSGAGERTYTPHPYIAPIERIERALEDELDVKFGLCFANYYAGPRQHLGWHSDNSPSIDHRTGIAVVSFGAEREIWLRPIGAKGEPERKILLEDGSVFYMPPGFQQTHQHRIPKAGHDCGPRLSLTFRKQARA